MNRTQFYSPQNMKEQHLWCSSLRATQATILAVATLTAFALLAAVFPLLSPSEQMSNDLQLCIFISPVLISLLCAVHSYSGAMLTMLRQSALNLSGDDKFIVLLSTRSMIRASVYSFFTMTPIVFLVIMYELNAEWKSDALVSTILQISVLIAFFNAVISCFLLKQRINTIKSVMSDFALSQVHEWLSHLYKTVDVGTLKIPQDTSSKG